MRNITGPPVEGDDFFGRKKEIEYVWNRIANGNNLIFPSPRRVGKTSFALKLIAKAAEENWQTVHLNLEKISSEQKFIEMLLDELKKQSWWTAVKDKADELIAFLKPSKISGSYAGAEVELEWNTKKESIYRNLSNLLNHGEETLIFFDELTVLLNSIIKDGEDGKKNVTSFLHWLREIRIKPGSKIRWIFCSSVGIENFTHEYGISDTINDVPNYHLKSYTKAESVDMLTDLGKTNGMPLEITLANAIVDKLEYCLPFFLQIFFEKINYLTAIESAVLDNRIVDAAYNILIEENHFNTWIERINEQYGDNKVTTLLLLKHVCIEKSGTKRDNLINKIVASGIDNNKAEELVSLLLYKLKNDGYLMEEEGLYRFRSPLLRDFWFNRFVK